MVSVVVALLVLSASGGGAAALTTVNVAVPAAPSVAGLPLAALRGQVTGVVSPDTMLELNIGLPIDRQGLAQAAREIYTPSSSRFGHYLTPSQVAGQFGASNATIQRVRAWLTRQGFQIVSASPLHTSLTVRAPAARIAQVFRLQLQVRSLDGRAFFGPSNAPILPASIAPLITSIAGLSNYAQVAHIPLRAARTVSAVTPRAGEQPGLGDCTLYGVLGGVTRDKVARSYAFTELYNKGFHGEGMKIGVVELGDPYSRNDVANYALCNGAQLHLRNVQVDGPLPPGAGAGEATLDLEMIAGLAPEAEMLDYQASTNGTRSFIDALNQIAAEDQVQVVSVSYGLQEDQFPSGDLVQFNDTLELLAVEGISVFIASGDCGAFTNGVFGQLSVSFPASAPWAIGVGGTSFAPSGGEVAWSSPNPDRTDCQNTWGTGGGLSQVKAFTRPLWQTGSGVQNQYSNGERQVPDVAAVADDISIYLQGAWGAVGGTSASAPMWAAGAVLVDQALQKQGKPFLGGVPNLYAIANHPGKFHPFHDITLGNNLYYKAGPGWDYPTGLGTPNFPDIARVLGATV
jgi:kumamolisin